MSKPIVVLTRRWPQAVETELASRYDLRSNVNDTPMTTAQFRDALMSADVVCPTVTDAFGAEVFVDLHPKAQLLANFGVGYNHIDVAAAQALGLAITNTPGVLTDATAEIAMTLLLSVARRTGQGERVLRANQWQGWRPTDFLTTQVTGKTLGIIGMGRIGQALARQAHHGFNMPILYCNRSPLPAATEAALGAERCSLEELLGSADFVSLNCPSTPETRHLMNAGSLAQMQPHAFLINTARGDVINETDLVDALQQGIIAGAGLDVYVGEPVVPEPLKQMQQVVLLPHMGSGTTETREAMGRCAVANIDAWARGEALPNRV